MNQLIEKQEDELPRQLRTDGGKPCSLSEHPRQHAQEPLLRSTAASKPTASLPWLPCTPVSTTRPGFAQPPCPTHPAPTPTSGPNVADNKPRPHSYRFLPLPTLSSGCPSEQEVPSTPEVAALHPKTHPAGAWKPQDIQQP